MTADASILPRDPLRRTVIDTQALGARRHLMHGLVEVDVTRARRLLREHAARTGAKLSFTAWLLACVGRAVAEHPQVHAYTDWRGRRVRFHEVDVATAIDAEIDGRRFPVVHVVRGTQDRDVQDLTDELRSLQRDPVGRLSRGRRALAWIPGWLRRLVFRLWSSSPWRTKRYAGTVMVTAVGMFGDGPGWGLSLVPLHTLALTVGGIGRRPALVDGQLEEREHLCLTVSLDHDVVDGAPAARFVADLTRRIREAEGLEGLATTGGPRRPPRGASLSSR